MKHLLKLSGVLLVVISQLPTATLRPWMKSLDSIPTIRGSVDKYVGQGRVMVKQPITTQMMQGRKADSQFLAAQNFKPPEYLNKEPEFRFKGPVEDAHAPSTAPSPGGEVSEAAHNSKALDVGTISGSYKANPSRQERNLKVKSGGGGGSGGGSGSKSTTTPTTVYNGAGRRGAAGPDSHNAAATSPSSSLMSFMSVGFTMAMLRKFF